MSDLKPCPFCGSKAKHDVHYDHVHCTNCDASMVDPVMSWHTKGKAAEAWNSRVSQCININCKHAVCPAEVGNECLCTAEIYQEEITSLKEQLAEKDKEIESIIIKRNTEKRQKLNLSINIKKD